MYILLTSTFKFEELDKNIYGLIGLSAVIVFAVFSIILILYYTKYLRIEYRERVLQFTKEKIK